MGNLNERKKEILELLAEDGTMTVSKMSERLSVSAATVRNDLTALEKSGFIVRTRGGAFPAFHRSILDRRRNRTESKDRIARYAADLVEDGSTIMIEAGTTTAAVARYLLGKQDVHVVTNSTLLLPHARVNPSLHLSVVGGEFRPLTESLVGPLAIDELEQFYVQIAFIGTDGFTTEHGLTTHLIEGAEIVRKMAGQADRVILVADSTKYGRTGFARVLPLSAIDELITDEELPEEERKRIEKHGVEVVCV